MEDDEAKLPETPAGQFVYYLWEERKRQRQTWTSAHDDAHTSLEWGGLLARYVGRVIENALAGNAQLYRKSLWVLAAVALAAYEAEFRRAKSFLRDELDVAPPEATQ